MKCLWVFFHDWKMAQHQQATVCGFPQSGVGDMKPSKAAMELTRLVQSHLMGGPLVDEDLEAVASLIDAHPMLLNLYNALNKAGGKLRIMGFDHRGKCNFCQEEKASDTGTHLKDCLFVLILDAMANWQPQAETDDAH